MKRSPGTMFALLIIALTLVAGCVPVQPATQPAPPPPESLSEVARGKVLFIARENSVAMETALTEEISVMMSMLEEAGFVVVVATP